MDISTGADLAGPGFPNIVVFERSVGATAWAEAGRGIWRDRMQVAAVKAFEVGFPLAEGRGGAIGLVGKPVGGGQWREDLSSWERWSLSSLRQVVRIGGADDIIEGVERRGSGGHRLAVDDLIMIATLPTIGRKNGGGFRLLVGAVGTTEQQGLTTP